MQGLPAGRCLIIVWVWGRCWDTEKGWGVENKGEMAKELVTFQTRLPDCSKEAAAVGQEGESSATQAQLGQQCGHRRCPHL